MRKSKRKKGLEPVGLFCLRCGAELLYAGHFELHEGTRWGFMGGLFELAVNREGFDICKCPNCGKAEFFDMTVRNNSNNNGKSDR